MCKCVYSTTQMNDGVTARDVSSVDARTKLPQTPKNNE